MKRREFLRYGISAGAGALLPLSGDASEVELPAGPGFRTRHVVVIIYGGGARKKDVVDNVALAPYQNEMAREGTIFTEDYGDTASVHSYMVSELLQGRGARPSQRPLFPTWNESVRKKTGAKATDFFMLQGVSYYRAWTVDVKHYSQHPDYGLRFGATSFTMNKTFGTQTRKSPREIVDLNVEHGLGASRRERRDLEDFVDDVTSRKTYLPPSTRQPVSERPVHHGDARALTLAPQILKAFRPRILTIQICGLDEGHADFGREAHTTGYDAYARHLQTTDELIGRLWREVRSDASLRDRTALILRPDCGRDGEIDAYGQLGHTEGDHHAHSVWTMALGPDFKQGEVVTEPVSRRDLAPTITYLMSGEIPEHATGRVRTQMFRDHERAPGYAAASARPLPNG